MAARHAGYVSARGYVRAGDSHAGHDDRIRRIVDGRRRVGRAARRGRVAQVRIRLPLVLIVAIAVDFDIANLDVGVRNRRAIKLIGERGAIARRSEENAAIGRAVDQGVTLDDEPGTGAGHAIPHEPERRRGAGRVEDRLNLRSLVCAGSGVDVAIQRNLGGQHDNGVRSTGLNMALRERGRVSPTIRVGYCAGGKF